MLGYLQDFFSVSPREARGIVGMTVFSGLLLVFPAFLKHQLYRQTPEEADRERLRLDSALRVFMGERQPVHQPAESGGGPAVNARAPALFDPNVATDSVLAGAGIPFFLVRRIISYREKGGSFRNREDLKRIYGFPDSLFKRVSPFVVIAGARGRKPEQGREERILPVLVPFDINKADTVLLQKLKGIGSARARTIVNYRNALGGFHSTSQFEEIFGLDSVALGSLYKYARILSPPSKIAINAITFEELARHPYLRRNRKSASAIVRYREQHGPFASTADLSKIIGVPPAIAAQLFPYLDFRAASETGVD